MGIHPGAEGPVWAYVDAVAHQVPEGERGGADAASGGDKPGADAEPGPTRCGGGDDHHGWGLTVHEPAEGTRLDNGDGAGPAGRTGLEAAEPVLQIGGTDGPVVSGPGSGCRG